MKGIKKLDENLIAPYRSLTITNSSLPDNKNWQAGTLKCNTSTSGLQYKVQDGVYSYFHAEYILLPNTVTSELIQDGTIQTVDLADECVTNDKIHTRGNDSDKLAINHIKLQKYTLTNDEMAPQSVWERALKDYNVSEIKMADNAISNRVVQDDAIQFRNMAQNSVGTKQLINYAVTTEKIFDGHVTNAKLAEKAVSWNKIAPYSIAGGEMAEYELEGQVVMGEGLIAHKTITNWNIAERTINSECMMNGAVTNRVIGQYEVYGDAVAPQGIKPGHIENNSLTSIQIAEKGIDTESYADYSITKIKLDNEIINVVDNAVIYDEEGNVTILKAATCDVVIGSEDVDGKSNGNGYLRVYGDIKADRVYNMSYSDLAEGYIPGEELEAGDIVELREDGKVYKAFNSDIDSIVVGVVSDEFATCYGATKEEIEAGEKVAVGLIGKVHVKVNGPVKIGEAVRIGNMPGVGALWSTSDVAIGKALETSKIDGVHKVLCLIKPF